MGKSTIKSQSGQVLIENVLMMVVLVGAFLVLVRTLQSSNYLNAMTRSPWASLKVMVECGHWSGNNKGCIHPNLNSRHITTDPR